MLIINPKGVCDAQVPVFSTVGRGPKGPQGDPGEVGMPKFSDEEWSIGRSYEALTVVGHDGDSYTAKQDVPVGIEITDTEYWAHTGSFNVQVEAAHQEAAEARQLAVAAQDSADDAQADIDELDDRLETIADHTPYSEITSSNKSNFINPSDLTGDVPLFLIQSDDSGEMRSRVMPGLYQDVAVGFQDIAAACTIANDYIKNGNHIYYRVGKTGISYSGTMDSYHLDDPKEDPDDMGRYPMDCNTLMQLIGHGCPFGDSIYKDGNSSNFMRHKMFEPISGTIRNYWKYGYSREDNTTGHGRMLSDGFAKMLYDAGKLGAVMNRQPSTYPLGAILFSGVSGDAGRDRFLGIVHCYMIIGVIGSGTAGLITVECTDTDEDGYGIVTDTIDGRNILHTKAYYMPPFHEAANFSKNSYMLSDLNKRLDTDPALWIQPQTVSAGVVSLCPRTGSAYDLTVTLTPQEPAYGRKAIGPVTTTGITGPYVLRIPYGYDCKIESTSTDTFNINYQKITSDRYIRIPTRIGN